MNGTPQVIAAGPSVSVRPLRPAFSPRHLHGSDLVWAIAFALPYAAVLAFFVVYPVGYALWLAGNPSLYADLLDDPLYLKAVANTLLFVGVGVNLKMFLALLLSGFFMRPRWWIKALLVVFLLPWAFAAVQAFISVHWILIGEPGLVNRLFALGTMLLPRPGGAGPDDVAEPGWLHRAPLGPLTKLGDEAARKNREVPWAPPT